MTALLPGPAAAHGFGRLYNLPVPFWLYAWGAAAALLVSFLVIGYFISAPDEPAAARSRSLDGARWVVALRRAHALEILKGASLFTLVLCVLTGLLGNPDPYRNFSMTTFWIMFVLAFTYVTALAGDLYASINPWQTLAGGVERLWRGFTRGRIAYAQWLGEWPALALYMGFISFELFGFGKPFSLGIALLGYTLLNLAGVWLVGAVAWFRHCEFFAVFLRLVALMAPLEHREGSLRLRAPLSGLLQARPAQLGAVVFALFMLSSTAFDGLRATQWWVRLFWQDPTGIVTALSGDYPMNAYARLRSWYVAWEALCLVASPFLYFAVYLGFVAMAKAAARSARPLRELALDFAYPLLPIALAYNVTHYFTLLLSQGPKILSLLSDPFGWGWNLFGMAYLFRAPILPTAGFVWHSQVILILLGHIASVYLAHRVALRVFASRREALLSQLPMLGLMMSLTVAGLWILAQPLTAVLMR